MKVVGGVGCCICSGLLGKSLIKVFGSVIWLVAEVRMHQMLVRSLAVNTSLNTVMAVGPHYD